MAVFQKNDGGIMDVIRCDEPNYLIWKWYPQGTSSNTSKRANAIRWGSSLRVKDGSVAVFVYPQENGVCEDFIEGPYDGLIDTKNFPVLASLVGTLYQGGSPFQAEIYFINLANLIQVKFGVPYFDVFDSRFIDFGVPTAVRGSVNFNISNYKSFIKLHRLDEFNLSDFQNQVRDAIIRHVKDVVTNAPYKHGIPVVQLERRISEINELIEEELTENLGKDFGVKVSRVDISAIEIDKDSRGYKKLESLTQNKTSMLAQGVANIFDVVNTQRTGAKKIKETFKDYENSKGLGEKFSGTIGDIFGGKKAKNAPPIPITAFFIVVEGKKKGPYEMAKLRKMLSDGKISGDSLVWKEGMKDWKRASDVDELVFLFETTVPPIPNTNLE